MIFRSKKIVSLPFYTSLFHAGCDIIDRACVQEVAFRNIIVLAFENLAESADGLRERHITSVQTGKLF